MNQSSLRSFEQNVVGIRGYTILLDVDGTLIPDGAVNSDNQVRDAVAQLRDRNTVYLISNGRDALRVERLAREFMVNVVPAGTPAGKPFARAARGIPITRPFLVIGDRLIIDGLFARNLGVPFLRVRSKRYGNERWSVRLAYMLEDIVSLFL
jgi:predicted HAD superfamily phosphohydrolase YqeG